MRLTVAEKYEIIQLVDKSDLGINRTLKELGIHKSTYYKWYKSYLESSVYRILKRKGIITAPGYILLSSKNECLKTMLVHEMCKKDNVSTAMYTLDEVNKSLNKDSKKMSV